MRCRRMRCSTVSCAEGCAAAASARAASGSCTYGTSAAVGLNGQWSASLAMRGPAWRDLERDAHGMRMLCVLRGAATPRAARCAAQRAAHSAGAVLRAPWLSRGAAAAGAGAPPQCWLRQEVEQ